MQITDFEKQIKKDIDPDLSIRINPNAEDIAGVYYKEAYIGVAVPPVEIHEEFKPKYCDSNNYPYRNISTALEFIKGKVNKFKDPEVYKVMTTKI